MHGYGVLTKSGNVYNGEFRNNKQHGNGTLEYQNGDRYEGQWQNDMFHGVGTFKDTSGNEYSGDWKENKQNGWFKSIQEDG